MGDGPTEWSESGDVGAGEGSMVGFRTSLVWMLVSGGKERVSKSGKRRTFRFSLALPSQTASRKPMISTAPP